MGTLGEKTMESPDLNKGTNKENKVTLIPLEIARLNLTPEKRIGLVANFQINKPSTLPVSCRLAQVNWPTVCLDLKRPEDLFQLAIMQRINHKNIMRMEAVKEISTKDGKLLAVFYECYSGLLLTYLENFKLVNETGLVPSKELSNVIRQIIEGVEELRVNGYYHGSLCFDNIYYCNEDNHKIIIKLANFRNKGLIDKEVAQLEDWNAIGMLLDCISTYVKADANVNCAPLFCSLIDDLALKLKSLTDVGLLERIKEDTLNHPFFWDKRRRTRFFICDIPRALNNPSFLNKVHCADICQLPWDHNPHFGLVKGMNDYRKNVLNIGSYDGWDRVQNVKFVSGGYTHEEQIKGYLEHNGQALTVDSIVQYSQPRLCLELHRLLTE